MAELKFGVAKDDVLKLAAAAVVIGSVFLIIAYAFMVVWLAYPEVKSSKESLQNNTASLSVWDACWWQTCRNVSGYYYCMALPPDTVHYNVSCTDIRDMCEYRGNDSMVVLMGMACAWDESRNRCMCVIAERSS